jgi:hypothetical protein
MRYARPHVSSPKQLNRFRSNLITGAGTFFCEYSSVSSRSDISFNLRKAEIKIF